MFPSLDEIGGDNAINNGFYMKKGNKKMYSLTQLSCGFICMIIRNIEGVDCYANNMIGI